MTATLTAPADPTSSLGEPVHVLTYPISVEYVRKWKLVNALAEVVSNAIDAAEADPNRYSVTYDETTQTLIVEDDHATGAGAQAMIFGHSTKTESGSGTTKYAAIGQFGEGLKLASLKAVTDPQVRFMLVETVGYAFVPGLIDHTAVPGLSIPTNGNNPKVLTWNLYPSDRASGTRVTIGIPAEVAHAVIARFRHLNEERYIAPEEPGTIIHDQSGKVYIGGVLVSEDPSLALGYDLALATAKAAQNRDRTLVDEHVLGYAIANIHRAGLDKDTLVKLTRLALDGNLSDKERGFLMTRTVSADTRRTWAQVRTEVFGDADVFHRLYGSSEHALNLTDDNYVEVTPNGLRHHEFQSLMHLLSIPEAAQAVTAPTRRSRETEWSKRLTKAEQTALDTAVDTIRAVYGNTIIDKVKVFDSTDRSDASCMIQTLGFYQPNTGLIAVKRSLLDDPRSLMETLFHEAAHRAAHRGLGGVNTSQYTDRSRGFEDALGNLAVTALTHLAAGRTLDQVREVTETTQPACPVSPDVFTDRAAAMEWVFTKNSRPDQRAVTNTAGAALVLAALTAWADKNNVPARKIMTGYAKEHFVTSRRVRSLSMPGADIGPRASFQDVRDVCDPLGVNPAAVWWAMVGVQGVVLNRSERSRAWGLRGEAKQEGIKVVQYLRQHPDPDVSAHADAAEQLLNGSTDPKPGWDTAAWLTPVLDMLATAREKHPARGYITEAQETHDKVRGARNVADAWDAYQSTQQV